MAFQQELDILNYLNGQGGDQGQQGQSGLIDPTQYQGGAGGVGGQASALISGADSGSASSGSGRPTGGVKPFTNVQSYLQSYVPSSQDAELAKQGISGVIQGEKSSFDTAASDQRAKAQDEQKEIIGQDAASSLIQGASGIQDREQRSAAAAPIASSLSATYNQPETLQWGQSSRYEKMGDLSNRDDYVRNREQAYRDTAGNMSGGARLLQRQFDMLNPNQQQVQQDMVSERKGVDDYLGSQRGIVDQELQGLYKQYTDNQVGLRNYLGTQAGDYQSRADKAMQDANTRISTDQTKYQNELDYINSLEGDLNQYNARVYGYQTGMGPGPGFWTGGYQGGSVYDWARNANLSEDQLQNLNRSADKYVSGAYGNDPNRAQGGKIADALFRAKTLEFNPGEQFNQYGADAEAVRSFNLINQLLGDSAQDQQKNLYLDKILEEEAKGKESSVKTGQRVKTLTGKGLMG